MCIFSLIFAGTVKFAFKVHQFAGGFDDGCNTRFVEISNKIKALQADKE